MKKRAMSLVAAAGVAAAATLATAVPAEAAGTQTYQNRATQRYVTYAGQSVNSAPQKDASNSTWTPVSAGGGAYRQIKAGGGNFCLDSNADRNVYLTRCDPNNVYQQWSIQKNGSFILFKSRGTGLCLDANIQVYTNPCSAGNFYQNWF